MLLFKLQREGIATQCINRTWSDKLEIFSAKHINKSYYDYHDDGLVI